MTENENGTEEKQQRPTGRLFVVSTSIGNDEDITLRALRVMRSCDLIVCEEAKVGARMLHKYNITQKMDLLNEQNEFQKTQELLEQLMKGKSLALVSDAGTPVFADPGQYLVQAAIEKDIPVTVVPGPTSIMAALVRSTFPLNQFVYAGFLSRIKEERFLQLRRLSEEGRTVALLETPYRMMPFLEAAAKIMPNRKAYIGCNLTMPYETHHYGSFAELLEKFRELKFKGEFVVCFEGASYSEGGSQAAERKSYRDRERKEYEPRRKRDFEDAGEENEFQRDRFPRKEKIPRGDGETGGYRREREPRREKREYEPRRERFPRREGNDFDQARGRYSGRDREEGGSERPRRKTYGDKGGTGSTGGRRSGPRPFSDRGKPGSFKGGKGQGRKGR